MSGAFNGKKVIPHHLLEELEYKDALNLLAKDLFKTRESIKSKVDLD